jgi:hypothetical protein
MGKRLVSWSPALPAAVGERHVGVVGAVEVIRGGVHAVLEALGLALGVAGVHAVIEALGLALGVARGVTGAVAGDAAVAVALVAGGFGQPFCALALLLDSPLDRALLVEGGSVLDAGSRP